MGRRRGERLTEACRARFRKCRHDFAGLMAKFGQGGMDSPIGELNESGNDEPQLKCMCGVYVTDFMTHKN